MKTKRLVALILVLAGSLLSQGCGGEPLKEGEVLITGTIRKQEQYELKEAYVQLVPVEATKEKMELTQLRVLRNLNGEIMGTECISDYPRPQLPPDSRFRYSVQNPKPGRYILALQHIRLKGVARSVWAIRPLGKDGKTLILEIPEGKKPAFKMNVGDLAIAFAESDKLVVVEYPETVVVRP